MRTNYLIVISLVLCMFSIQVKSFGQEDESSIEMRKFGMGLHVEQFKLNDLTSNVSTMPANKLIFTITPTKHFRIEPEVGFVSTKEKETDFVDQGIFIGIGGFGMFQKGKTNFYIGLRFEEGIISSEYNDYNTVENKKEKINRSSFTPTLGFEYFFSKHFSFGGELGLKHMIIKITDSQYTSGDKDKITLTTDTGLMLRCYF